jgi:hypothetical protein
MPHKNATDVIVTVLWMPCLCVFWSRSYSHLSYSIEWKSANQYLFDYKQMLRFGLQRQPQPNGSGDYRNAAGYYLTLDPVEIATTTPL